MSERQNPPDRSSSDPAARPGKHLHPRLQQGVTVVDLLDRSIVDEPVLDALDAELTRLMDEGHACLAINFSGVGQVSSRVIGSLVKCFRTCQAKGGAVKVFGVGKGVGEAFSITNFHRLIDFHADEAQCLASGWPSLAPTEERPPLPTGLEIPPVDLSAPPETIVPGLDEPPVAPAGPPPRAQRPSDTVVIVRPVRPQSLQTTQLARVRLTVLDDPSQSRTLEIRHARFVIGRDPSCHLRAHSPLVSRVHALLETNAREVILRDLGSSNGTLVNGLLLKGEEITIADGDLIQVGPLRFTLSVQLAGPGTSPATPAP